MADYEIDNTPPAIYLRDLEIAVNERDQGLALSAVWSIMEDIVDSFKLAIVSEKGEEDRHGELHPPEWMDTVVTTVHDYMMNNYGED
jgi:hypothetical protein